MGPEAPARELRVAGRDLGFGVAARERIALAVARRYRETIQEFAQMRNLDIWYARLDIEEVIGRLRSRS